MTAASRAKFPRASDLWPLLPAWAVCLWAIWSHTYWLSADGASHLYNAVALAKYLGGGCDVYREAYFLNPFPVPNLAATLLLSWLTTLFPPLVAEKLLLSAYTLLLPLSVGYAVAALEPRGRVVAQLAFPLALGLPLVAGWYNFAAGTVLSLFTVGFWLRQDRPLRRGARGRMLGLFLAVYLCHPFPLVVTALILGCTTLWQLLRAPAGAVSFPRRLWCEVRSTFLPLLPAVALLAVFWALYDLLAGPAGDASNAPASAVRMILRNEALAPLTGGEMLLAPAFGGLLLALSAAALATRDARSRSGPWYGLLFAAAFLLLLALAVPDRAMGGGNLVRRLLFSGELALLLWLGTLRLARPAALAVAALACATTLGQVVLREPLHDGVDAFHGELRRAAAAIGPDSMVLAVALEWTTVPRPEIPPILLRNAAGYLVADRCFVDLGNYEGRLLYSPLLFRPQLQVAHGAGLAEVAAVLGRARPPDWVLLWGAAERWSPERRGEVDRLLELLGRDYRPAAQAAREGLSTWLYRRDAPPAPRASLGSAPVPAR